MSLTRLTPGVSRLLLCMLFASVLQWFVGWCWRLDLAPFTELRGSSLQEAEWWRLLTYSLAYRNPWQFLLESLLLWLFGCPVEERLGERRIYLIFVIASCLGGLGLQLSEFLGQSCAWSGATFCLATIELSYAWLYPEETVQLFLGLLFVPARVCYVACVLALLPVVLEPSLLPPLVAAAILARVAVQRAAPPSEGNLMERLRRLEFAGLTAEERQKFDRRGKELRQDGPDR